MIPRLALLLGLLAASACAPPGLNAGEVEADSTGESTMVVADLPASDSEGREFVSDEGHDDLPFECDPFKQDCPEGEKCVAHASTGRRWDGHECVPVLGGQAPGEPCSYGGASEPTDDCDETSACWDVEEIDGELVGTCLAFCLGSADDSECPPGSSCLIASNFSPGLCADDCDPIAQDCGPGLGCYWANTRFGCVVTMQDIPVGEPCSFINDCAAGLACVADAVPSCAGSACCSAFCDLELGGEPCVVLPGTSCVGWFEQGMAPAGYENVGICALP